MKAIEFTVAIQNDEIKIPQEFSKELAKRTVRIIVLVDEETTRKSPKTKLSALELETKNLKFTREEANER